MMEKRKHSRSSIRLDAELVYPDGEKSRVKIRDLSIEGLFVETVGDRSPEIGARLTITFLSIPHQSGSYSIKARVQRLTNNGIAMTFIDFGLDDLRFIEILLSSPSLSR